MTEGPTSPIMVAWNLAPRLLLELAQAQQARTHHHELAAVKSRGRRCSRDSKHTHAFSPRCNMASIEEKVFSSGTIDSNSDMVMHSSDATPHVRHALVRAHSACTCVHSWVASASTSNVSEDVHVS